MQLHDRVRRLSTGELGIIVALRAKGLFEVMFGFGQAVVHEDDLAVMPLGPDAQLENGLIGEALPYALRLQALYLQHAYRYDPLSGLSNARIEPQLHQIFVAHRVANRLRPRMILADEVGLGKTIEAGLILKELTARQSVERVLIVCPASLQYQWQFELKSKFNEDFEIIDGAATKFLGRGGVNPWTRRDRVITSMTFASRPARADQIIEADWDLVIFDEAHRVRRRYEGPGRYRANQAYDLADELKDAVDGLLALTATPMQLHPFELYSLIELIEPGLYPTYEAYERRRGDLPALNEAMKALEKWPILSGEERTTIYQAHRELLTQLGFADARSLDRLEDSQTRKATVDGLIELHPLASVLLRNRKSQLGGFQPRHATRHLVDPTQVEMELYEDVTNYLRDGYNRALAERNNAVGFLMVLYQKLLTSSSHALRQSFRRRINGLQDAIKRADAVSRARRFDLDEMREGEELSAALLELETVELDIETALWEIGVLQGFVDRLGGIHDSKADVLLNDVVAAILDRDPDEKILIFTGFIATQEYLAHVIRSAGYSVIAFNGQMSLDEKEEAARRFRDEAQVMITTEAGGEGRNFQFAHIMVNYDLPWNPMRVEQRIGRLDRIGQKRPVQIFNLALRDTIEERVLDILEYRIQLFEEAVGSLDPILGDVERDLERLVVQGGFGANSEAVESFGLALGTRVAEARLREEVMADLILDAASFRLDEANDLLERSPLARHSDLRAFLDRALGYYGGTVRQHGDGGDVISLAPRLAAEVGAAARASRGVFDPMEALVHEDLDFFAFGHELIDKIVAHLAETSSTTAARKIEDARPGISVEIWYALESEGVKPSGVLRRHVIGEDLTVVSQDVDSVPAAGESIDVALPGWLAAAIERSREEAIEEQMRERARVRAEDDVNKRAELERERRIADYRRRRLKDIIEREQRWVDDKQTSGSERDRRVLPARQGKLAKRREELASLETEYELIRDKIRSRHADVTLRVLAAGLVVGQ